MKTTMEIEARAIRKLLAQLVLMLAANTGRMQSAEQHASQMDSLAEAVLEIDREADAAGESQIDGRDEF